MRTIKASEIGSFLYCQRAWWYNKKGVTSENIAEMAAGTEIHNKHGRTVMAAGCLRTLSGILFLGGIVLVVLHFASQAF